MKIRTKEINEKKEVNTEEWKYIWIFNISSHIASQKQASYNKNNYNSLAVMINE